MKREQFLFSGSRIGSGEWMRLRRWSFFTPLWVLACLNLFGIYCVAQQGTGEAPPTIQMNVNRVLVPVVVRDKQGRTVGDLKQQDFQVFDNGKPRPISAFTLEQRGIEPKAAGDAANGAATPVPAESAPQPPAKAQRFIIFLFDDIHMSAEDLAHVQKASTAVLDGLATSDIGGVVSLSGKTNSGLTRDHARLRDAIMSLETHSTFRPDPRACPNVSYYQAAQIEKEHSHDGPAFQDAFRQVLNCNPGLDPKYQETAVESEVMSATNRALSLGRQDALTTYANISAYVRTVATLPGQRILIVVSPGFLAIEQESMTLESRVMDLAAQSNVTVNALDSRGLYTSELDASTRGSVAQSDYNRTSMSLAEGAMESLADGTGGTFFHNSNDLGAGFRALTEAPEAVYVLELSVNGVKQDGTYHHLKVKLARNGLELSARRGYYTPRPEKVKK
jgi:VWFA-related protein